MKFSLRALFVVTAAFAAGFGIHVTFWERGPENHELWLGWYLVAVALLTTACLSNAVPLRDAFRSTAIFGWAYFVFVLKAGLGIETMSQAQEIAVSTRMGLTFMGICFLIAAAAITLTSTTLGKTP